MSQAVTTYLRNTSCYARSFDPALYGCRVYFHHRSGFVLNGIQRLIQRVYHRHISAAGGVLCAFLLHHLVIFIGNNCATNSDPSVLKVNISIVPVYDLPPLDVRIHMINTRIGDVVDPDGQVKMMRDAAVSLQDAAKEKNESVMARVAKAREIVDSDPDAHFLLWHDLEY